MTDIDRVRQAVDISSVIGEYVRLKPIGANLTGLCPFHQEKSPSFTVSKNKQVFHCHGCHVGGDVFSFIQRMESASFPQALRSLAERAGISVGDMPARNNDAIQAGRVARDAAERLAEECVWFYQNLRCRFYERHDDLMLRLRNYQGYRAPTEELSYRALMRTYILGYKIARWVRAIRRLDQIPHAILLQKYQRVRHLHKHFYDLQLSGISQIFSAIRTSK